MLHPSDPGLIQIRVRPATVYVSRGETVMASEQDGFLRDGAEHGLFADQTRLLSRYRHLVDGERVPVPVTLSNVAQDSWLGYYLVPLRPGEAHQADLWAPEQLAQQALELRVSRVVGDGMHEDLDLANHTQEHATFRFELDIDADFADQNETGGKPRQQHGTLDRHWDDAAGELSFDYRARHHYDVQGNRGVATLHRGLTLRIAHASSPPTWRDGRVGFDIALAPHATWHACLLWIPRIDGETRLPPAECRAFRSRPGPGTPDAVFLGEATAFDSVESETLAPVVLDALERARRDLLALRLRRFDRDSRAWTVAAGLPMYVALFGRDTLTAAWEAALLGPELMRGTLPVLAELQGSEDNDWRDEQPGRMLHEAHTGPLERLNFNPKGRYYGAHTTSAFYPFVVAQLWHWTADRAAVAPCVEPPSRPSSGSTAG